MNEQLENCNFIKAILMIFVIMGHSVAFWTGEWFTKNPVFDSNVLKIIYLWVSSFHTYCFVFVSGYIFSWKMFDGYKNLKRFILKKFFRLIVPYLFVAIIWVVPSYILLMNGSALGVFKNYILCTSPSQLWFLWMLFWVFIIAWMGWKFIRYKPVIGLVVSIIFYFVGVIWCRYLPNFYCMGTALQYSLFFFLGCRLKIKEILDERIISKDIFISMVGAEIIIFLIYCNSFLYFVEPILSLLLSIVGTLTSFYSLQYIGSKIAWKDSKMFRSLSRYTFPMYLFHQQVIYISINYLNGKLNPYFHALINFVIALSISYMISCFFMRFKYTRMLIGEKN